MSSPASSSVPGDRQTGKKAVGSGQIRTRAIRKKRNRAKGWLESVKEEQQWIAVERLAGVARGVALILENVWDDDLNDGRWHIVVQGLSEALRQYADEVDVLCFQSAGDLARSMSPYFLTEILQRELDVMARKV